jgi:hypothetical protein
VCCQGTCPSSPALQAGPKSLSCLDVRGHWTRQFWVGFEPGDSSAVAQDIAAKQGASALTPDLHFDDIRNLSLTSLAQVGDLLLVRFLLSR